MNQERLLMNISKVMVIGGAGFIGSHLVDVCLREGLTVSVYDNFSTGKRSFLPTVPELQISEGDILDTQRLTKSFSVITIFSFIKGVGSCQK